MNKKDINIAMKGLESLAEIDLEEALKKMVELYFNRNDLAHEVSSSIELWVFEKANENIINYIKQHYPDGDERLFNIVKEGLVLRNQ